MLIFWDLGISDTYFYYKVILFTLYKYNSAILILTISFIIY